jgi:hypothetical protein
MGTVPDSPIACSSLPPPPRTGGAASSVLTGDADIVCLVLTQLAAEHHGWSAECERCGRVCQLWRACARRAAAALERWSEHTFTIPRFSTRRWPRRARTMEQGEVRPSPPLALPPFTSNGAHDWQLAVYNPAVDHRLPRRPALPHSRAGKGGLGKGGGLGGSLALGAGPSADARCLGVALRAPSAAGAPADWVRRVEACITVRPPHGSSREPQIDRGAIPQIGGVDPQIGEMDRPNPQMHPFDPQVDRLNPQIDRSSPQIGRSNPEVDRFHPRIDRSQIGRSNPQIDQPNPHTDGFSPPRAPLPSATVHLRQMLGADWGEVGPAWCVRASDLDSFLVDDCLTVTVAIRVTRGGASCELGNEVRYSLWRWPILLEGWLVLLCGEVSPAWTRSLWMIA